ncbi:hypothetical protein BC831DRAFT_548951 [Entophlyctis helioformis]|nr:hypothetical protein BC831DRAFT_548951 [Entophlyctis helioformis]
MTIINASMTNNITYAMANSASIGGMASDSGVSAMSTIVAIMCGLGLHETASSAIVLLGNRSKWSQPATRVTLAAWLALAVFVSSNLVLADWSVRRFAVSKSWLAMRFVFLLCAGWLAGTLLCTFLSLRVYQSDRRSKLLPVIVISAGAKSIVHFIFTVAGVQAAAALGSTDSTESVYFWKSIAPIACTYHVVEAIFCAISSAVLLYIVAQKLYDSQGTYAAKLFFKNEGARLVAAIALCFFIGSVQLHSAKNTSTSAEYFASTLPYMNVWLFPLLFSAFMRAPEHIERAKLSIKTIDSSSNGPILTRFSTSTSPRPSRVGQLSENRRSVGLLSTVSSDTSRPSMDRDVPRIRVRIAGTNVVPIQTGTTSSAPAKGPFANGYFGLLPHSPGIFSSSTDGSHSNLSSPAQAMTPPVLAYAPDRPPTPTGSLRLTDIASITPELHQLGRKNTSSFFGRESVAITQLFRTPSMAAKVAAQPSGSSSSKVTSHARASNAAIPSGWNRFSSVKPATAAKSSSSDCTGADSHTTISAISAISELDEDLSFVATESMQSSLASPTEDGISIQPDARGSRLF